MCVSARLKTHFRQVLLSGHKAKDITSLIAWKKETWKKGSARRSSLKGRERANVSQTSIGTVSKATLGKLLRDGVECLFMAYSESIDTNLN